MCCCLAPLLSILLVGALEIHSRSNQKWRQGREVVFYACNHSFLSLPLDAIPKKERGRERGGREEMGEGGEGRGLGGADDTSVNTSAAML